MSICGEAELEHKHSLASIRWLGLVSWKNQRIVWNRKTLQLQHMNITVCNIHNKTLDITTRLRFELTVCETFSPHYPMLCRAIATLWSVIQPPQAYRWCLPRGGSLFILRLVRGTIEDWKAVGSSSEEFTAIEARCKNNQRTFIVHTRTPRECPTRVWLLAYLHKLTLLCGHDQTSQFKCEPRPLRADTWKLPYISYLSLKVYLTYGTRCSELEVCGSFPWSFSRACSKWIVKPMPTRK